MSKDKARPLTILGIETSCDETAAAVVREDGAILGHRIASQIREHAPYGGVVPEIAARAHVQLLDGIIRETMQEAGVTFQDLDAIAATAGPGLIGGVMVGTVTAKTLCLACDLPFIAVNHLEGHALTPRLVSTTPFPYLLLLVSGGHCQLLIVEGVGKYVRLGTTIDDAVGEAFDKTAKLLGLSYPGGPAVEKAAAMGDPGRFPLPRPMLGDPEIRFSFSGLKSAVRRAAESVAGPDGTLAEKDIADLCAGTQAAIVDCLQDRAAKAMEAFRARHPGAASPHFVVAGGVAANLSIRSRLEALAQKEGFLYLAPPLALCTDNGAMIAWAGLERFRLGMTDPLDTPARPRWPLDRDAQPMLGSGKKGAKS